MQKRVVRIIPKSTFNAHLNPIFKKLEQIKISNIKQLELGKFMFSFSHSFLPVIFKDYRFIKQGP